MNKHYLDLEKWPRRAHCEFFLGFDDPWFGLTAAVDAARCRQDAASKGHSFFLRYLYASLQAALECAPFRQRLEQHKDHWKVAEYDTLTASPVIPRPDGTFGFAYFPWESDFHSFAGRARALIKEVQQSTELLPETGAANVIHYSVLPWVHFTALSHPRRLHPPGSPPGDQSTIPKITFGKAVPDGGKLVLPVALHAHHALVDGRHAGEFYVRLQELLDEPV